MTLSKYRITDLTILTLITCGLDAATVTLTARLQTDYVVSLTTIFLLIIAMRWSGWSLITAVAAGITSPILMCTINGSMAFWDDIAVYVAGNVLVVLAELVLFKTVGKKRINQGNWFLVLYAFTGFIAVVVGRTATATAFGMDFINSLKAFGATEALNLVLAIIILFITNRQENGMFRDQKQFFLEVRSGGNDEK